MLPLPGAHTTAHLILASPLDAHILSCAYPQDIEDAVQRRQLPRVRQLLGDLQPTEDEMSDVLWHAYDSLWWPMVQTVQRLWSPQQHGQLRDSLTTMAVYYPDTCVGLDASAGAMGSTHAPGRLGRRPLVRFSEV